MPVTVGVQVPGMAGAAVNPVDPALGKRRPLPPRLSDKDAAAPRFAQLAGEH